MRKIIAGVIALTASLGLAVAAAVILGHGAKPAGMPYHATGGWHSTRLAPDRTYEAVLYHDARPATTNWG